MKKPLTTLLACAATICAAATANGGAASTLERGISYYPASALANASAYQKERCKLDFRRPANATNFATVVWFHGGGLVNGAANFLRIRDDIAQAAVSYRFLQKDGSVTGDDCIDDAAAAVAWALDHVAEYGGDPKKVFVSGMSAGGYLTMMVGMDPSRLAKWGHKPTELAGIVPISGQATKHFNVRKFAGDADPQYLPKIDRLAPLNFCSADLPPILSVCGEPPWEWPARSEENRLLVASCVALGHKSAQFVQAPFCSHGRVYTAGVPYLEMFVLGKMPPSLVQP